MMNKRLIISVLLLVASVSGFGQFTENGYKDLKLGNTPSETKKVVNFKLDGPISNVVYDGLDLELYFMELDQETLYYIKTHSPNAKLEGVSQNLMGKKLKEIQSILGEKLTTFDADGPSAQYYVYNRNKAAEDNYMTSCVLDFNEQGVLQSIMAIYNP